MEYISYLSTGADAASPIANIVFQEVVRKKPGLVGLVIIPEQLRDDFSREADPTASTDC